MKNIATSTPTENQVQPTRNPLVKIVDGQAITTSIEIAEKFEKNHFHVMRNIQKLVEEIHNDFKESNFGLVEIIEKNASGADVNKSYYTITRDGFTLLAMGFTGKKAMQFKLDYIAAFNLMEKRLIEQTMKALNPPAGASLTPAQQREVQIAVTELAHSMCKGEKPGRDVFAAIYRRIKDGFQVGTYKQIPAARFDELMTFVGAPPKATPHHGHPVDIRELIGKMIDEKVAGFKAAGPVSDDARLEVFNNFLDHIWAINKSVENIIEHMASIKTSVAITFPDLILRMKAMNNRGKFGKLGEKD